MTARSKWRGQPMYFDGEQWRFHDGAPVREHWKERPCGHCGEHATAEGHDACIANLPGTINACCGHGEIDEAYVQFSDVTLRGAEAVEFQRQNGGMR